MRRLVLSATFVVGLVIGGLATLMAPQVGRLATPYAGQQDRSVSSLSAEDVAQLKRGQGWGLAKPAELNGYPGPAHVIELADDLALTAEQSAAVQRSFEQMQTQAVRLGKNLIEAERLLDAAFVAGTIDANELQRLLAEAEAVRAALRGVHLAAHLEVTPLLTPDQRERYAALRGYGENGHSGHGSH